MPIVRRCIFHAQRSLFLPSAPRAGDDTSCLRAKRRYVSPDKSTRSHARTHTRTRDQKKQKTQVGVPKVKVRVENSSIGGGANSILLDPIDFLRGFSVLKDELVS